MRGRRRRTKIRLSRSVFAPACRAGSQDPAMPPPGRQPRLPVLNFPVLRHRWRDQLARRVLEQPAAHRKPKTETAQKQRLSRASRAAGEASKQGCFTRCARKTRGDLTFGVVCGTLIIASKIYEAQVGTIEPLASPPFRTEHGKKMGCLTNGGQYSMMFAAAEIVRFSSLTIELF